MFGLITGLIWPFVAYKVAYYAWMLADFLHNPREQIERGVDAFKQLTQDLSHAMQGRESTTISEEEFNREVPRGGYVWLPMASQPGPVRKTLCQRVRRNRPRKHPAAGDWGSGAATRVGIPPQPRWRGTITHYTHTRREF